VDEGYREACEEVRERATTTLDWATKAGLSLLTLAVDHLSLGRAHLGPALTAPGEEPDFRPASEHLDRAVHGLREAGTEHNLPWGLLARAALRRLSGDPEGAAADLREAQEIAERGSMRLHEADAHLEWTRLCLDQGDHAAARRHLDRARELVQACGYGQREREVRWLEGQLEGAG
jgi:tetratricopeptide (TPR) repeat protein